MRGLFDPEPREQRIALRDDMEAAGVTVSEKDLPQRAKVAPGFDALVPAESDGHPPRPVREDEVRGKVKGGSHFNHNHAEDAGSGLGARSGRVKLGR